VSFRRDVRESAEVGCVAVPVILIVGVTMLVLAVIWAGASYGLLPVFLHQEAQAQRASPQYVESKRTLLIKLQQDYEQPTATEGQRAAILRRMREERDLIAPEAVPPGVGQFIAQHGG
jgi:hypothetical protein